MKRKARSSNYRLKGDLKLKEFKRAQIPSNWKGEINYLIEQYEDEKGLVHGFQKDAIQNSVGAIKNNCWSKWSCSFDLVTSNGKEYLLVQDFGTVGLEGKNYTLTEISEYLSKYGNMDSNERLARFSSFHNSGGNTGPGLFGIGKKMYVAASNDYSFYFESVSKEGYRVNHNLHGNLFEDGALEEEVARKYIIDETGLEPINIMGTRMIIPNPREEIKESIISGAFVKKISETWWRIIEKYQAKILVNGITVEKPYQYQDDNYLKKYNPKKQFYYKENKSFTIKKFGLFVCENLNKNLAGFYFYRKDMKIGEIQLNVPDKLNGKLFGYIELKEDWEESLAEIENSTHYDVTSSKKAKREYQYMKNFVNDVFTELMIEWGFIEDKENKNKQIQDKLEDIAEELQNLFNNLGYDGLGHGNKKNSFDVRLKDVKYPSEGNLSVYDGESISFGVGIRNNTVSTKDFSFSISIESNSKVVSNLIVIESIKIEGQGRKVYKNFNIEINKNNSMKFEENRIVIKVNRKDNSKIIRKELKFYYSKETPKPTGNDIEFTLFYSEFPNSGSRRVNTDEKVGNLRYRVENCLNSEIEMKIRVQALNGEDVSKSPITDINSCDIKLLPFQEKIYSLGDAIYEKDVFLDKLSKGKVIIRGSLISKCKILDKYFKSQRIHKYDLLTFFNIDEKNGNIDDFFPIQRDEPEKYIRSYIEGKNIILNIGHPAYIKSSQTEFEREYLREQMLKQYVILYLKESKYSIFGIKNGAEFSKLDPENQREIVFNKIEDVYYRSFGGYLWRE